MIEKKTLTFHHYSPQGPSFQQDVRKARVLFTLEFQVSATEELWLEASLARAAKVIPFQRSEQVFSGDLSEQL